jgi:Ferritin-like
VSPVGRVTPPELRDLAWVRGALQSALAVEHSTMPLYSAAMFSLEVQNYPSYNTIRSVLMEEMVHMSAVANVLAALGDSPRILRIDPGYPGTGLPGGIASDVPVVIAQLSPRQLRNFMRLEAPMALLDDGQRDQPYPTVGHFYSAIRAAVVRNAGAVREAVRVGGSSLQVGGNIGFRTIVATPGVDPVEQICAMIDEILVQGEGTDPSSIEAGEEFQNEGSHYARFAELWYGARYRRPDPPVALARASEAAYFGGEELAWPEVINTLAVPEDGYAAVLALDPDAAEVSADLATFDAAYTGMMVSMDRMWNGPAERSWPSFGEAVAQMNELRVQSCFSVMRHQVPDDVVVRLKELYPGEFGVLAEYTDLDRAVFYGPRFINGAITR